MGKSQKDQSADSLRMSLVFEFVAGLLSLVQALEGWKRGAVCLTGRIILDEPDSKMLPFLPSVVHR